MPQITPGDTAWVLVSAALVLFMTPGLAMFYGGMIRAKNVLAMLMMNYIAMGVVTLLWVGVGASLAFSGDVGGFIGDLSLVGLRGIGIENAVFRLPVPDSAFLMFQLMFAIITPAVVAGAAAERMKFSAWLLFVLAWTLVVYVPLTHWVWGGGFLADLGVLDFAGGLVVEINSGASALALALVLGRRRGWPHQLIRPHNLPLTILGAGILWFGWFGFNAGSALASNGIAAQAFMTGKPTTLGFASGAVAGLVAITPAAGFVTAGGSVLIGLVAGVVCYWALRLKNRYRFDDALDVVAVHMVGGIIGTLLLGVLASNQINAAGSGGLEQLGRQAIGVVVAMGWAFSGSLAIATVLNRTMGIRVSELHEYDGLDVHLHEEQAYTFEE